MNPSVFSALKSITLPLLLCIGLLACAPESSEPRLSQRDVALNNRGVALMGSFDYPAAVSVFSELVDANPDWTAAKINLAIAYKNRQEVNDAQAALTLLKEVLIDQPNNARANYNAGVLELYQGQIDAAQAYFQAALSQDPEDAYAHYYLGQCQLRKGQAQAALQSYQTAIDLDPQLRSAYYSAALVLRRLGRSDEAAQNLQAFQRLENNPTARLAEFKYTRMGPKSLAAVAGAADSEQPDPPTGDVYQAPVTLVDLPTIDGGAGLSTVDVNQDGHQDILVLTDTPRLYLGSEDGSLTADSKDAPWGDLTDLRAVAWGDIDNDGLVDAYLCRQGTDQLWRQSPSMQWQLSRAELGDRADASCVDAAMLDADHDGDLDIVLLTEARGADLINNNRDGTFRSLADKLGVANDQDSNQHLLATDLDADRDLDLIFIRQDGPHTVLINDRLWNYQRSDEFGEFEASDIQRLSAFDFNADGQVELVGLTSSGNIEMWSRDERANWIKSDIYKLETRASTPPDLLVQDVDGDTRADIMVLAEGAATLLGEAANSTWAPMAQIEFQGGQPIPVVRGNQGSSLLAVTIQADTGQLVEWAPGAGRNKFVTMTFTGKHDAAETMRSNTSGIGTQVGVRIGSRWVRADTSKNSSLAGYHLQPMAIGVGQRDAADFVEIDWSDGVYQTELEVVTSGTTEIAEAQRQLGSCPILFAWNGERFDFVTDILGVGAQGFLVKPGTLLPPRPWEYVPFAPGTLRPREGRLQFKLTEPMEESSYIDAMTLHAYDVPQGFELLIDERMGTGAPTVSGDAYISNQSMQPIRAYSSQGGDVLEAVLSQDNIAMSPGNIDRRFIGILEEDESLTLEFADPLTADENKTLMLVADSWVELPYSQTHFAAWQAGREFGSVSLAAKTADGDWQSVYPDFGIPAGMPRVMTLPLLDLPSGTTALRLTWNREIYWDRIRIAVAERMPKANKIASLAPQLARVEKSGFSRRVTHAQRRPEYLYNERRPFGDVRYPTGMYTALGEMTELITEHDDALAIIGPGEGVHVEFEVTKPPAAGFERWHVLETRGWAKDKDLYTHSGETVEPLPRSFPQRNDPKRDRLHEQYNVRFQSGR